MEAPNKPVNYREQILELHQQLIEYVQNTNQHYSKLTDRLNTIQKKVDKLPTKPSVRTQTITSDVDRFTNIEAKIAEMSEEINKLDTLLNVTIKDYLNKIYLLVQEHVSAETD